MVLALWVGGLVVVLVAVGLFVFALRRRLIQRSGGTFDCSLRWDVSEEPDPSGKGWVYGVARYSGDRVDWFRVFSYSPSGSRRATTSMAERSRPRRGRGEEELALLSDSVVLGCLHRGTRLELAMSEDALTGFLAWLEAAPPGQRVNVA